MNMLQPVGRERLPAVGSNPLAPLDEFTIIIRQSVVYVDFFGNAKQVWRETTIRNGVKTIKYL